jgi:2-iminobutanoate/2-iminopropanoate deaminase
LESETQQAMKNLMAVITAAGSNPDKVIKCTLFVLDMKAFKTINEVYGSFFRESFPARETVQVSALPAGASVEISAIAAV